MPSIRNIYQLRAILTEVIYYARELGDGAELVAQAVWLVMLAGDPNSGIPRGAEHMALETMREVARSGAVTAALASLKEYEERCAKK